MGEGNVPFCGHSVNAAAGALATAFALGAAHAVEVDHMVAVSAFVVQRPRVRVALEFGLRWAAGHALAVFLAGSLLLALDLAVPPSLTRVAEAVVGTLLLAVGAWAMVRSRRLHLHAHGEGAALHAHLHAHDGRRGAPHEHEHGLDGLPPTAAPPAHRHSEARDKRAMTLIGAVHGLSGTAPVLALIPVAMMPSKVLGVLYLVMFGVGTAIAMSGYSLLAGYAATRAAERSVPLARRVALATGLLSVGAGVWWLVRAVG